MDHQLEWLNFYFYFFGKARKDDISKTRVLYFENTDRESRCFASWLTQAHPRPHNTAGTVASHHPAGENYLLCAFFPISMPRSSSVSATSL